MVTLTSKSYTIDQRPNYPLFISAKRYWDSRSPYLNDPLAVTLIFTHSAGYHKELWEPTIDDLYALLNTRNGNVKVREMWSIDAPNHGEAGILNEKILKTYRPRSIWAEYSRTVHAFLTGVGHGLDIDFSRRRLVGVGSSMGAVCLLLSLEHTPSIHFESLILSELMTVNNETLITSSPMLYQEAAMRSDTWLSREEAYNALKRELPWKAWDDRALRIYVRDGLRSLPTPHYPDRTNGVTLKCSRVQEIAAYSDHHNLCRVYDSLAIIAQQVPIHVICVNVADHPPPKGAKDVNVGNVLDGLDHLASISRVEGGVHHVIPKGLPPKIYNALAHPTATIQPPYSKWGSIESHDKVRL